MSRNKGFLKNGLECSLRPLPALTLFEPESLNLLLFSPLTFLLPSLPSLWP